jgi:hypothetical protein
VCRERISKASKFQINYKQSSPYRYLFAAIPVGGEGNLTSRKRT